MFAILVRYRRSTAAHEILLEKRISFIKLQLVWSGTSRLAKAKLGTCHGGVAWNFYTGGYQPAQKWLKDRKGRRLEFEDILHYQKIIVALTETDRLMGAIDRVGVE